MHSSKIPQNTHTLLGSGQSSSRSVMTAGPRGSVRGITCTMDLTTTSHPASLSAMECSFNMDGGGSWSLQGGGRCMI